MAGAYPGFHSMKQLRELVFPPGRGASPSQSTPPQQYIAGPHLYTWVKRDNVEQRILSKETTRWQGLGVERANHYATAPPEP